MPARARPARCAIGGIALFLCSVGLAAPVPTPVGAAAAPRPLGSVVIAGLGAGLGPGYTVTAQGPLDPSEFAADAPDPAAASGALEGVAKTVSTYDRVWQDDNGRNQVQDLLVRFATTPGAVVFEQTARQSLDRGEILQRGSLPSVPGAERVTYFPAAESGVGEVITMRSGDDVALLSFFTAASEKTQAITPAGAERVALAQQGALGAARRGTAAVGGGSTAASTKRGGTSSSIGWAVLAVAVLMAAVATPLLLRRRRDGTAGQHAVPKG
jgi:hypothetical protein